MGIKSFFIKKAAIAAGVAAYSIAGKKDSKKRSKDKTVSQVKLKNYLYIRTNENGGFFYDSARTEIYDENNVLKYKTKSEKIDFSIPTINIYDKDKEDVACISVDTESGSYNGLSSCLDTDLLYSDRYESFELQRLSKTLDTYVLQMKNKGEKRTKEIDYEGKREVIITDNDWKVIIKNKIIHLDAEVYKEYDQPFIVVHSVTDQTFRDGYIVEYDSPRHEQLAVSIAISILATAGGHN